MDHRWFHLHLDLKVMVFRTNPAESIQTQIHSHKKGRLRKMRRRPNESSYIKSSKVNWPGCSSQLESQIRHLYGMSSLLWIVIEIKQLRESTCTWAANRSSSCWSIWNTWTMIKQTNRCLPGATKCLRNYTSLRRTSSKISFRCFLRGGTVCLVSEDLFQLCLHQSLSAIGNQ